METITYERPRMIIARSLLPKRSVKPIFDVNGNIKIFLEVKKTTMRDIKLIVYNYEGLTEEQAEAKIRTREIVEARQIAMYFIEKYRQPSWTKTGIAKEVNKKSHATVISGVKHIKALIDTEVKFAEKIKEIDYLIRQLIKEKL